MLLSILKNSQGYLCSLSPSSSSYLKEKSSAYHPSENHTLQTSSESYTASYSLSPKPSQSYLTTSRQSHFHWGQFPHFLSLVPYYLLFKLEFNRSFTSILRYFAISNNCSTEGWLLFDAQRDTVVSLFSIYLDVFWRSTRATLRRLRLLSSIKL